MLGACRPLPLSLSLTWQIQKEAPPRIGDLNKGWDPLSHSASRSLKWEGDV